MTDDDFEEEAEPELDEESLDEEDLDEDELEDEELEDDDDLALEENGEGDATAKEEAKEVPVAEPAAAAATSASGEEDDEELHPDDVEEPFDVLM